MAAYLCIKYLCLHYMTSYMEGKLEPVRDRSVCQARDIVRDRANIESCMHDERVAGNEARNHVARIEHTAVHGAVGRAAQEYDRVQT
jgi:hypothetical protein